MNRINKTNEINETNEIDKINGINITLRLEKPEDYREIEELTREAFWGQSRPDCNEHLLVHKLRECPAFIPELDYVAQIDGVLAGNIMYSKSKIVCDDSKEIETIIFGPLSVLPRFQNKGVGKALVEHTSAQACQLGYRAIFLFGHPDYYPRLGFRRAAEFGITTDEGKNFDSFMVMPLYNGALDGIKGKFYYDPVFHLCDKENAEFDKNFPFKEKTALEPIMPLLKMLKPQAREAIEKLNYDKLYQLRYYKSQRELSEVKGIDSEAINTIAQFMNQRGFRWGEA